MTSTITVLETVINDSASDNFLAEQEMVLMEIFLQKFPSKE